MGRNIYEEAQTGIAAGHVADNPQSSPEDVQAAEQAIVEIRGDWVDDFEAGEES